jgi:heme exporter protein B
VVLLGTVGFSALGTLFAAIAANTRAREVMLPVLLFPLMVPLLIASVKATAQAVGGEADDGHPWLGMLAAFDAIFLTVSMLVFEYVIDP